MTDKNSLSPMMEQYFRIKREHPDALLFFRLGDFYEMFYEDAKTASPVLEIALTSRQKVPMCGVPYHAVNSYLAKLLRRGFKVAVCEQMEDPRAARGVVRREVIKVLTPGTAVEIENGEARENVYIASVLFRENGWGLAFVDLVSGEVRTLQGRPEDKRTASDELFKTSPREILFPEGEEEAVFQVLRPQGAFAVPTSAVEAWAFDLSQARQLLEEHFRVRSLAGFGLDGMDLAISAAGALLHYVRKVRKDSVSLIHRIRFVHSGDHLVMDAATVRNLELVRNIRDGRQKDTLLEVMDLTMTSMGGRMLRGWLLEPLCDAGVINARLDAVEEALRLTIERHEVREELKGIHDLERLTGKISLAAAHPRDLVSLKKSLEPLPPIREKFKGFSAGIFREVLERWDDGRDIAGLIDRTILDEPAFLTTEGGIVKEGFSADLDELRTVSRSGKAFIALLEKRERERTGISSLKVRYNKVFGFYIDVTKPNLHLVPSDYIRKQTLLGSERFLTPELKEHEEKILHAEERMAELESRIFIETREAVAHETTRLQRIAADVARLDVLLALGELASRRNYCRPTVDESDTLGITGGRHPVIEVTSAGTFIPNDTHIDCRDDQILIITGPNMGGKSTYLRQVALISIMAQMGSFVPASAASLGLVDRIFTRIGAMDLLSAGQSTFMVEMLETANILNSATPKSLILLDEVGRGTSTFDGLSIAWAVAEHLHEKESLRAKTLFATHYHELTELALTLKRIKNYHVSVKEWKEDVIFLRKIVPGPSDQSYGIHVAKLAGIPREVIDRAREILFNLEKQEFDESGQPRMAYRSPGRGDRSQRLLFPEDREFAVLEEIKDRLESFDPAAMTPLEALNLLNEMKTGLKKAGRD
jgi:DNA mismatch repair protein MutS